ncbi:MAG: HIT family protein [Candidatus Hodarchaeales archaeon]|jgi:diadenosine tetraphosphate (Ap4A) HIT family hydrolase
MPSPEPENCPFCQLREDIICENNLAFAFYDGFPVSPGHLLIVLRRHVVDYFDSSWKEKTAIFQLLDECKKILDERRNPDGYNIGINCGVSAGQSVMHLHVHMIPRYAGDVTNPKGGVRGVIPSKQRY